MSTLRDRVASQLEALQRGAGLDDPWSDRRDASTRWLFSDGALYDAARVRFHQQLVAERRASAPVAASGSFAAVVTAGPPGAGKSTALARDARLSQFRSVDADDFNDALLLDARERGLLDRWVGTVLADGRAVAPRELSGFVHAESTAVADAMREAALAEGEDIVIHGTLSSTAYVDALLSELDQFGYGRLVIYDVQASAERAVEQALQRWWRVREAAMDALGGRFVPSSAIWAYYQPHAMESVTSANARALRDRASDLGWHVELVSVTP